MQMHAHPHVLCVCVCVQYLTPHSMMRGYLARDILSAEVADVLKEKAEHSGERSSFFASLALFWLCHWVSEAFLRRLGNGDCTSWIYLRLHTRPSYLRFSHAYRATCCVRCTDVVY